MKSPGWRSSEASTVLTDTPMAGTTASAWAFTSWVSWSRSLRRNGRTWIDDITGLLGTMTKLMEAATSAVHPHDTHGPGTTGQQR